jgi:hypothetical protein
MTRDRSDSAVSPGRPVDQLGTDIGKTTLVTAPAAFLAGEDRGVLFEDTAERPFDPPNLGEVVWNRTQKCDVWGQKNQQARPETEWIRRSAPALRIISDDQWHAAHGRVAGTRERLKKAFGSMGHPQTHDIDSRYLLSGFARCAVCAPERLAHDAVHEARSGRAATVARSARWSAQIHARRANVSFRRRCCIRRDAGWNRGGCTPCGSGTGFRGRLHRQIHRDCRLIARAQAGLGWRKRMGAHASASCRRGGLS